MRLKAYSMMIAVTLERGELSGPVDDAFAHRRPLEAVVGLRHIFYMTMANAIFGQLIVSVGIRNFALLGGVTRIPIQHEVPRTHAGKRLNCFRSSGGVAGEFVFQD